MSIGQHLMLGFDGAWPSDDFLQLIADEDIGGVILFARNLESQAQITELIECLSDVGASGGSPILIGVDHEGGRVFRLPEPFTKLPSARIFGKYYDRVGATQAAPVIENIAALIGEELRAVGFNLNFAPVLDVDTCSENPIIGDRSFHTDPAIVAKIAGAFIQGFSKSGILSCGKHFPGHGDTCEDSHLTMPHVSCERALMQKRELVPFQAAIAQGVPALMTAHVLYAHLDQQNCGTLSPVIMRNLLRESLGFEGVLFSDDLLMKGITEKMSVPEASLRALQAGCDCLLICRDFTVQKETIRFLKKKEILELAVSAGRLQILKSSLSRRVQEDPLEGIQENLQNALRHVSSE
jgi:beta-N-acetylhexosaminidase